MKSINDAIYHISKTQGISTVVYLTTTIVFPGQNQLRRDSATPADNTLLDLSLTKQAYSKSIPPNHNRTV